MPATTTRSSGSGSSTGAMGRTVRRSTGSPRRLAIVASDRRCTITWLGRYETGGPAAPARMTTRVSHGVVAGAVVFGVVDEVAMS